MRTAVAGAVLTAFSVLAGSAAADDWPSRPVTMVVPFAAGGPLDAMARVMAPSLSEILGKTVVVENVAGAGGMNGSNRVAKAPPDGYQFVFGTAGTHAYNQSLHKNPLYNSVTEPSGVRMD